MNGWIRQKNVYVPGRQVGGRAPAQLPDGGQSRAQLTGVEVAGAVGQRVRDPGVQPARVLARGDAVEDRGQCRAWLGLRLNVPLANASSLTKVSE